MGLSFTFAHFTPPEAAVGLQKPHHAVRLVQAINLIYNMSYISKRLGRKLHEMHFGFYICGRRGKRLR